MLCSPAPRLYWSKRGGSLPSYGRYKLPATSYNSVLELYNIEPTDDGDYICRAVNSHGSKQITIQLDVQGDTTSASTIDGGGGGTVVIYCT